MRWILAISRSGALRLVCSGQRLSSAMSGAGRTEPTLFSGLSTVVKEREKKHVRMETRQGGMYFSYYGRGGLEWMEVSLGRFRARLAKY